MFQVGFEFHSFQHYTSYRNKKKKQRQIIKKESIQSHSERNEILSSLKNLDIPQD